MIEKRPFPSGVQINNIYDKTKLEQIQTPEEDIHLTYLCGTKVGSITNGTDTITYGYDGSLKTSETLSGTLNQFLLYTYNNEFNLQSFAYAGKTYDFSYDNDGLLTHSGDFAIIRNLANGLPETVTGGALNLSHAFNGYGEISREDYVVGGQYITSWGLSRDKTGKIIEKTETMGGITSNYEYGYGAMGRLLSVTKNGALGENYQYGLNGTQIYEWNTLKGVSGRSFTYSDEDHLLTAGDVAYQYHAEGFLIKKIVGADVTHYDYSSRGELLSVAFPDGRTIEYILDPLGRRVAKKVNGVITEKYLWQGLTRLLAVYD